MKTIKLKLIALLILSVLILSGCSISFGSNKPSGNDGGVYLSANRGEVWQQKNLIPTTSGRPATISSLDANELAEDPSDPKAFYYASTAAGLFYTYDQCNNWQYASGLGKVAVSAVAVDPADKCMIYAAVANRLYKSEDCNRTWEQVYVHNDPKTIVNQVKVDFYDSKNVYVATSRGEVLKSEDAGENWRLLDNFSNSIEKLALSPKDSRVIFAATAKKGLLRSKDGGESWEDLKDSFKDIKDYKDFRDISVPTSDTEIVYYATQNNIYKSTDFGGNWSEMQLITPEKGTAINAIAVNPADLNEIYYITNTTFYRSLDGGENWFTKKLPTTRAGSNILIDRENAAILYLTTKAVK